MAQTKRSVPPDLGVSAGRRASGADGEPGAGAWAARPRTLRAEATETPNQLNTRNTLRRSVPRCSAARTRSPAAACNSLPSLFRSVCELNSRIAVPSLEPQPGGSLIGHGQVHRRLRRGCPVAKPLDEPRAEQRNGRVAQAF